MCGFTGYLSATIQINAVELLQRMGDTIAHRGPDDSGIWHDNEAGIGLAHRRLSIVDLSPAGHQPMLSSSVRYVMAFNGEIYNHLAQRAELENSGNAPGWRGHSDTETVLASFDAWGIEATINKSIGMFAFAVWDKQTRQLTLGRDRLGEKPLYYGWQGQGEKAVFFVWLGIKSTASTPCFSKHH
jgi:asparagine synthase (glutamine-hydrolysing)